MLELWSNFIKYGDPTPPGSESGALQGVEWAPVTQGSHQYLRQRFITCAVHLDFKYMFCLGLIRTFQWK